MTTTPTWTAPPTGWADGWTADGAGWPAVAVPTRRPAGPPSIGARVVAALVAGAFLLRAAAAGYHAVGALLLRQTVSDAAGRRLAHPSAAFSLAVHRQDGERVAELLLVFVLNIVLVIWAAGADRRMVAQGGPPAGVSGVGRVIVALIPVAGLLVAASTIKRVAEQPGSRLASPPALVTAWSVLAVIVTLFGVGFGTTAATVTSVDGVLIRLGVDAFGQLGQLALAGVGFVLIRQASVELARED